MKNIKHKKYRIILASTSKARKELMKKLQLEFEVIGSGFEEDMNLKKNPEKLAIHLALGKAKNLAERHPESVIIGADTFILVEKEKIGKPISRKHATQIIKSMSGKTIQVLTGVAIIKTNKKGGINKKITTCEITKLKIKNMSDEEIKLLAEHPEALKISGAFSIEGEGGKMVEKIIGDFDNVIGLPVKKVEMLLKEIVPFVFFEAEKILDSKNHRFTAIS